MLYTHFTQEVLGLQGVIITKIESNEKELIIYAELERKKHNCISCGTATDTIHDYRKQIIKDIPAFGKLVSIVLRKRRYRCPRCGKCLRIAILCRLRKSVMVQCQSSEY